MTTIRFAYGDRGTGQIKAPYLNALNLRVGRNFVLGPLRLDVAIDIFKSAERRHRSAVLRWCNQIYSSNYALISMP